LRRVEAYLEKAKIQTISKKMSNYKSNWKDKFE
jgi:hypothetical protein